MKKINPYLVNEISVNNFVKHKVLITLNEHTKAENLPISEYKKLMENVLSAELDGNEINILAQNDDVIAIEPDTAMEAF